MYIFFALKDGCKWIYLFHKAGCLGSIRYVITQTSWYGESQPKLSSCSAAQMRFLFSVPHTQSWSWRSVYVLTVTCSGWAYKDLLEACSCEKRRRKVCTISEQAGILPNMLSGSLGEGEERLNIKSSGHLDPLSCSGHRFPEKAVSDLRLSLRTPKILQRSVQSIHIPLKMVWDPESLNCSEGLVPWATQDQNKAALQGGPNIFSCIKAWIYMMATTERFWGLLITATSREMKAKLALTLAGRPMGYHFSTGKSRARQATYWCSRKRKQESGCTMHHTLFILGLKNPPAAQHIPCWLPPLLLAPSPDHFSCKWWWGWAWELHTRNPPNTKPQTIFFSRAIFSPNSMQKWSTIRSQPHSLLQLIAGKALPSSIPACAHLHPQL